MVERDKGKEKCEESSIVSSLPHCGSISHWGHPGEGGLTVAPCPGWLQGRFFSAVGQARQFGSEVPDALEQSRKARGNTVGICLALKLSNASENRQFIDLLQKEKLYFDWHSDTDCVRHRLYRHSAKLRFLVGTMVQGKQYPSLLPILRILWIFFFAGEEITFKS